MNESQTYSLDELAEISGTEPRTIRSYVAKGLLPRPSRGRGAQYEAGTLDRLLAIKRLIAETGCSLEYCRSLLDSFDCEYIAAIASGREQIRVVDAIQVTARLICESSISAAAMEDPEPHRRIRLDGGDDWVRVPISEDLIVSVRAAPRHLDQAVAERILKLVREVVKDHAVS